jgi:glucose-1-phosphate adenylyltransferase
MLTTNAAPAPAPCDRADHAASQNPFPRPMQHGVLALVLAGGRGSRLDPLTAWRAKPAVPFGCDCRIIDFTLSNCLNSGIADVGVLTQYQAQSLLPHVNEGWAEFAGSHGHSMRALAHSRCAAAGYAGTADAVYRNLDFVRLHAPSQVLILAGDHIYNMDYSAMLEQHVERRARLTVGCVEVPLAEAQSFGVMQIDAEQRILAFEEKPRAPQPIPGRCDTALASMGIYVFDTDYLIDCLEADAERAASSHDFGHDIIPAAVRSGRAYAHALRDVRFPLLPGYWRDVGTIDAYWRSNLEVGAAGAVASHFGSEVWPLWTEARRNGPAAAAHEPAAWIDRDSALERAVVSRGACVGAGASVKESVLLPGAVVGPHCIVQRAVIEDGCVLPAGTQIGVDAERDRARFHITAGGVVLVTAEMLGQLYAAA